MLNVEIVGDPNFEMGSSTFQCTHPPAWVWFDDCPATPCTPIRVRWRHVVPAFRSVFHAAINVCLFRRGDLVDHQGLSLSRAVALLHRFVHSLFRLWAKRLSSRRAWFFDFLEGVLGCWGLMGFREFRVFQSRGMLRWVSGTVRLSISLYPRFSGDGTTNSEHVKMCHLFHTRHRSWIALSCVSIFPRTVTFECRGYFVADPHLSRKII